MPATIPAFYLAGIKSNERGYCTQHARVKSGVQNNTNGLESTRLCLRLRLAGNELQSQAIVAVAQTGRFRAIIEHVAVVPTAAHAVVFGTRQDQFQIGLGLQMAGQRIEKAGPAGAAVVLESGWKQRQIAGHAHEQAASLFMVERAAEWRLGTLLAQDGVLPGGKSFFPFGVAEHPFFDALLSHGLVR